jgi:hypothetical protein
VPAGSGTAASFIFFDKNASGILLPDRKMVPADRKFHGIAKRSATPDTDPCSRDQSKLFEAVVQLLRFGIPPDDAPFSR